MDFNPQNLTAEQIRAARAILNWRAEDLANKAGIGVATVRRTELGRGPVALKPVTADKIVKALQKAGIVLLAGDRTKGDGIRFEPR